MSFLSSLISAKHVAILIILYYIYTVYKRLKLTKKFEQNGFKIINSHWFLGGLKETAPGGFEQRHLLSEKLRDVGISASQKYLGFSVWVYSPFVPFATLHTAILDHNLAYEILSSKNTFSFPKGTGYKESKPLIGHGLLSSEGEDWKYKRRQVEPFFRLEVLKNYGMPILAEMTQKLFDRWEGYPKTINSKGKPTIFIEEIHDDLLRFTAETIGKLSLGCEFGGLSKESDSVLFNAFEMVLGALFFRTVLPWVKYLPTRTNKKFPIEINKIDNIVSTIIDSQWDKENVEEKNLLSSLLKRGPDGEHLMTKSQVADEVKTIIFAGHDTTAAALTWSFYLLGSNPTVQQKLYEEVIEILGESGKFTFETLDGMKYLGMVIKEVLRLYPSAAFSRRPLVDVPLSRCTIPAEADIYFLPFIQHRNPDIWGDDSHQFRPERWEEGAVPESILSKAYFPFSLGPRNCVGSKLAYLELRYLLVEALRKYIVSVGEGTKAHYILNLTLIPANINITFTPREAET